MKRRLCFSLVLSLLLCFVLAVPASAVSRRWVIDDADLLTDAEESVLSIRAEEIAAKYGMDIVILTVPSLGGKSAESYADDYFDGNGYGAGADRSGILLLLSIEYRDWAISTSGDTIYAVSDYGIQSIFSEMSYALSENEFYTAFNLYLEQLELYFEAYRDGNTVHGNAGNYEGPGSYIPGTRDEEVYYQDGISLGDILSRLLIALLIGSAAAGITLTVMRGRMNTARQQSGAADYLADGSFRMYRQQDMYLYSNTSRTRKPQNNGGGHGSGRGHSGSSIHRSSSGRSHGGGHGKF